MLYDLVIFPHSWSYPGNGNTQLPYCKRNPATHHWDSFVSTAIPDRSPSRQLIGVNKDHIVAPDGTQVIPFECLAPFDSFSYWRSVYLKYDSALGPADWIMSDEISYSGAATRQFPLSILHDIADPSPTGHEVFIVGGRESVNVWNGSGYWTIDYSLFWDWVGHFTDWPDLPIDLTTDGLAGQPNQVACELTTDFSTGFRYDGYYWLTAICSVNVNYHLPTGGYWQVANISCLLRVETTASRLTSADAVGAAGLRYIFTQTKPTISTLNYTTYSSVDVVPQQPIPWHGKMILSVQKYSLYTHDNHTGTSYAVEADDLDFIYVLESGGTITPIATLSYDASAGENAAFGAGAYYHVSTYGLYKIWVTGVDNTPDFPGYPMLRHGANVTLHVALLTSTAPYTWTEKATHTIPTSAFLSGVSATSDGEALYFKLTNNANIYRLQISDYSWTTETSDNPWVGPFVQVVRGNPPKKRFEITLVG